MFTLYISKCYKGHTYEEIYNDVGYYACKTHCLLHSTYVKKHYECNNAYNFILVYCFLFNQVLIILYVQKYHLNNPNANYATTHHLLYNKSVSRILFKAFLNWFCCKVSADKIQ